MVRTLEEAGIEVALSVAADLDAVKAAHAADAHAIELFTGSLVDLPPRERGESLDQLGDAGRLAAKLGMRVGAGGLLDDRQVTPVLEHLPMAAWVAVGRAWVGRSLLVGVERATRDLREQIA